jgi:hypothetical protein
LAGVVKERHLAPPPVVVPVEGDTADGLVRAIVAEMVETVVLAGDESSRVAAVMAQLDMKTLYDVVADVNAGEVAERAVVLAVDAGGVVHLPAGWAYGVFSKTVSVMDRPH